MTLPRRTMKYATLGLPVVLIVGAVLYIATSVVPNLRAARQIIDDSRASVIALQHQQANIDLIREELDTIEKNETALNQYAWTFTGEEAFFVFWETLAEKHSLTLEGPTIPEAAPSTTLLRRPVTVTLQGSVVDITQAIEEIQSHRPLLAISKVAFGGAANNVATAALEINTIWK